jgi:hypothetical protein
MPKRRLRSIAPAIVAAFLLSAAYVPIARSEPAFCLGRVRAYVKELDPILAEAKYSLTPIIALNDRYFPFVDCDPDALLEAVSHSRFFRNAIYSRRGEDYGIEFASDAVTVTFIYKVVERTSFLPAAGWVSK